jgi:rare lipoprotein A
MATLTLDGRPAALPGYDVPGVTTMIAQAEPRDVEVAPRAPRPAPAPAPLETPRATTIVSASPRQEPETAPLRTAMLPPTTPMPPARPFDLGTIPGADVPIIASPRGSRATAAFYAAPSKVTSMLIKRHPFDEILMRDLKPLNGR